MAGRATRPPQSRRAGAPPGAALVDRVVAMAVREGLKDEWTVHDAALSLLDLTHDPLVLKRARARVSEVVLRSPSLTGTRAIAALNVTLARLEADVAQPAPTPSAVPTQRASGRTGSGDGPHLVEALEIPGTEESLRQAATFVAQRVCATHAATLGGRVMLLAQELLLQTVGRTLRPSHLVLMCNGQEITVYVDLVAGTSGPDELASGTPDLTLVEELADDWGAASLRPGVRYWALLDL